MAGRRFKRRFNGRRKRFGTRRFVRKIARVAKRTIRRMSEVKTVFNGGVSAGPATSFTLIEITPSVLKGTSKLDRIGDKIRYKFLHLDFNVVVNDNVAVPVAVPTGTHIRVALLSSRVTTLVASDLLGTAVASTANIWFRLWGNTARVIRDWKWVQNVATVVGNTNTYMPVQRKFRVRKAMRQEVNFRDGSNVPAAPQDKLYLFLGNTNGNVGPLSVTWNLTMSFIDI